MLKFPVCCIKKNGKTRDAFSCIKFMFITCDEKINNLILLISLYMHYNCCTVIKRIVNVNASLCILHCILSLPFIG